MKCRFCNNLLTHEFIDLVNAPPSNSFLTKAQLNEPEVFYPLKLLVCEKCWLVQIDEYKKSDDIFNEDYAYFSSYSKSWLDHARKYVNMIIDRLGLNSMSHVIEIASNDGYLLQYFQAKGIPVLGIEPAANVAEAATKKGIPTLVRFFGKDLAGELVRQGRQADLIVGNNVLAHVPDLNDFVAGMKTLLKPGGVITMEFPHLMRLMDENQFDTIYHEHFSYYSFYTARRIFEKHGLEIFDVEQLPTHGGSLRIYARHKENASKSISSNVAVLLNEEEARGMLTLSYYKGFQVNVDKVKHNFVNFLLNQKRRGKKVAAYGAPAKGNTLLNYCGIGTDFIDYTIDRNPHKQGLYLPGTHIPIHHPDRIKETRPDYLLILPWNIKDEIMEQMAFIRKWGGEFVVPIPEVTIY